MNTARLKKEQDKSYKGPPQKISPAQARARRKGVRGEFRRARAEVPHQVRDKLRSRRPAR
ncbi:MAG: hypothetical protein A2729_01485 [Candidatus Buchananbacteria bacterium RIFCSPHIGHO2_01_FULL_39_14]|uniref:Uncharacterized protein n=2 Tax=Candidatus Buchananiibacteriota TaxID=1817903 RepID=A0A1G1YV07_9BACT|nr:MAG: hypothetical protein A2729_01485 [Candidatus Buchananbacteria bacterium RIFCSPHIGHO2_01_FULL_39_14]OGY49144.1 MAG: hypothetical protein A3D39_05870 [Candidatus Buchananbacteria bacterium RIFCSPHIGHO2_02_FULL_39_17]OGY55237.1 MAG: hypothetical protein A2912_03980 [Candidatus Buchananbacteria bacterium RIFCSPLOWO2_01_FULL_40_23b]